MASIDMNLPLRVKGFSIDPANAFAAAQATKGRILDNESQELSNRGREMQNAMGAMQLEEATGQFNAMKDYRTRAAAGDEGAMDALASYPEMKLKMSQTLDALDEAERMRAVARGKDVANAARQVLSFPDGPERVTAWNTELERLLKEGDISQEWADANRDNPSPEVLDSALRMGETLDEYISRKDAEKKAEIAARKENPRTEDDLTLSQKLEIEQAARMRVDAALGDSVVPPDPAVANQMFIDQKAAIMRELGIQPSKTTITPPTTEGEEAIGLDPGDAVGPEEAAPTTAPGESQDTPATPTTQEEFDALKVGAWFVNPADGGLYQKVE